MDVVLDRPLLSVQEAGTILGLSRATMYRSIRKGDLPLPLLCISGRWRIPRRALERLVEGDGSGSVAGGVGANAVQGRSAAIGS